MPPLTPLFPSHGHPLVEASLEPHSSSAAAFEAALLAQELEPLTDHHDGTGFLRLPELIDLPLSLQSIVTYLPVDDPLSRADTRIATQE